MPTGTTRIRLRPANNSRVPYWGQLAIGGVGLAYVLFSMWRDSSGDSSYRVLHWAMLVLLLGAVGYVLAHNAPLFGTQSYFEFTPGYLVHKRGLFRVKQVFAAETITSLDFHPRQLHVARQDGEVYALNLRELKGKKRRARFREQLRLFATQHGLPLTETAPEQKASRRVG